MTQIDELQERFRPDAPDYGQLCRARLDVIKNELAAVSRGRQRQPDA